MVPSLGLAVATAAIPSRADKLSKQNANVMGVIEEIAALAS